MAKPVAVPQPQNPDWIRFFRKVDMQGDCWIWIGGRFSNGYGAFSLDGKARRAHRVLWVWMHGDHDADGLDHICGNRACVRPDHLRPVSQRENVYRPKGEHNAVKTRCIHGHDDWVVDPTTGWRKCRTCAADRARERHRRVAGVPESRWRAGHGSRGERAGNARLTEDQVRAVLTELRGQTPRSQSAIARELGVSVSLINRIKQGKAWAHLGSE